MAVGCIFRQVFYNYPAFSDTAWNNQPTNMIPIYTQRTLILLAAKFVPSGAFRNPMDTIDYLLSYFGHMEVDLIVRIVQACLEYWRDMDGYEGPGDGYLPSVTGSRSSASQVTTGIGSAKRTMDDVEIELYLGKQDAKAKRIRRDSPVSISLSLESQASSSIVSFSQFSQRVSKPTPAGDGKERSPSSELLLMLKRRVKVQSMSYTGGQGSRGIQPPLTIEELRASVAIVQAWTTFIVEKESPEVKRDSEQLCTLIELAGKHYILWALSPGMQASATSSTTLTFCTYLTVVIGREKLDMFWRSFIDFHTTCIDTCLATDLSDGLSTLLICLSSGPWFPDLARAELWQRADEVMDLDNYSGQQQLVNGIHEITEGSEILARLRDNPDILQSCEKFREQKNKALRVMTTFPRNPLLDMWRRDVILSTLRDLENGTNILDPEASYELRVASLEALAVFSTYYPGSDMITTSMQYVDDTSEDVNRTFGLYMGMIACGYSCIRNNEEPRYYYDTTSLLYIPLWTCLEHATLESTTTQTTGNNESASHVKLATELLDPFMRLTVTCTTPESRLAFLHGLYHVFCHLDLTNEDLSTMQLGKFVLSQLFDSNSAIRTAAGDIAELLAKIAGSTLVDDPLGKSNLDNCLESINQSIEAGFRNSRRIPRSNWPLHLCRRIMRHLPEDHSIYISLLFKVIDQAFDESNMNRSGFVLDELASIARDKGFTNYRLLYSQKEYVCASVIKKLASKQDRWLDSFYYWTGLSQTRFLREILPDLVPKMISLPSQGLIEKVASILNEKPGGLCVRQIDHILAEIYMQGSEEHFQACIKLLLNLVIQSVDPGEADLLGIAQLTTLSTEGLLCCLSLELGDENQSRREKAKKVIDIVQGYAWDAAEREHPRTGKDKKPPLAVFMMRYILAIMSEVNMAILDEQKVVTLRRKVKYLRSLVALVQMLDPIQRSVLSQIMSPLNIALDIRGLRLYALQVLNDIVRSVRPVQLDVLLSHLVHTLVKHYPGSNPRERSVVLEILKFLILHPDEALVTVLPEVGELPDLPEFEKMNKVLRTVKSQGTFEQQLDRLIERTGNENAELAEQAVVELRTLLLANEGRVLDMAATKDKSVAPIMSDLIKALLSGISRFRGLDAPVPRRCVECLGIIGAIDPAKLSAMRLIPNPPVHTNFNDLEEAKNFVCKLIEVQLVGKTRSIGDIRSESRWAFSLQTLLSFCGITKGVLRAEKWTSTRPAMSAQTVKSAEDRWRAFPRHVQEVLELLIDAKYTRVEPSVQREHQSPLYPHVETFKEWLTIWTLVLIGKVTSDYAKDVFQACRHVVPYDTSTCLYILPHLVLNVLIDGSERDRKEIVGEMAAVLRNARNKKDDGIEQNVGLSKQASSELNQLGSQTVFAIFDHISKWIQLTKAASTKTATPRSYTTVNELSQTTIRMLELTLRDVQSHLTSISHDVIAMASFRVKGYARSLLHYEQYIRESKNQDDPNEETLQAMYEKHQEIYAHMEEPDGMDGISGLITNGTLNQNLLQCESAGRWSEALAYYELGLEENPDHFDNYAGLYRCHENLGQFSTLLSCVEGDIQAHPDWEQQLTDWRIASSWKIQHWDSLEAALSRATHTSFEVGLGQLILDMRDNRVEDFSTHLQHVRSMLIPPLAAASMESYSRAYEPVVQLHLLHELEVAFRSWNPNVAPSDSLGSQIAATAQGSHSYVDRLRTYQPILDRRSDSMAPSFRVKEQISRLRRLAFYDIRIPVTESSEDLNYLRESCGKLWLESAKAARKSGNSQVSYSAMLHAEDFKNRSAAIERAKWEFLHKHERQAIKTIDFGLKQTVIAQPGSFLSVSSRISSTPIASRLRHTSNSNRRPINTELRRIQDRVIDKCDMGFIRAKANLLKTRWMDRSSLVSPNDIMEGYRQATLECEHWEKSYYLAGQYCLKLYEGSKRYKNRSPHLAHVTSACRLYGKALTLGPKYLYQALPRLLTFWLELGQQAVQGNSAMATAVNAEFQNVNKLMEGLAGYLPEYMFLSAFPQIISRICHKNPDAFAVLQHIIVSVTLAFPDQAIWQMVSVSRSVVPERKRVCNMILDTIHLQPTIGQAITERIKEALELCDNLISLCMAQVPDKVGKLSLEKHFPKVYPQLRRQFNVVVPCQHTLWPSIPESSATMASHHPFKPNLPKIDRFMDEVEVMPSLQKPRKITIAGSDGRNYTFLCKPKDDLRKDAKVMEFNGLVNMLLRKDREASKRNLFVKHRFIIVKKKAPNGRRTFDGGANIYQQPSEIRRILDHEDHVRMFTKELIPKFPPYFYQWFIEISPEPTAWFEARLRYTRTTAVMSMVGHIMGLGDRHGENLLFDERNGDLVHVDFNCLFEQGKTFPKPERVPFRLTHNMIDAMGLPGYDGVYRLACERTLQVFRDNIESLASVLEGFIHDPLVEWSKSKRRSQQIQQEALRGEQAGDETGVAGAGDEVRARLRSRVETKPAPVETVDTQQNEKAQAILTIIKRKLNGTDNANPYVLSVRGQVEELIQAATSAENLSKMYIGWSAFL
ncbi:serine/threonine-protein kinase M1 [Mortierella sp. GBA43]|nr:serine/threonine-protein kinase M1 [Mortierella sp. GBA43]